jgi:hypothetical protein
MARPERQRLPGAFFVLLVSLAAAVVVPSAPAQADPLLTCPETPIIHQVCSVGTAAPNLAADGAEAVAGGIFDQATKWVVAGARSVVGFIGKTIDDGTRPDVNAGWFEPNYGLMVQVGVAFLLPLVIIAVLWSLLRHDAGGAVKIVTVKLPVAAMGMVVVTWLVNLLVAVTDNLSAFVGGTIGGSGTKFATGVVHLMEASLLTGNGGLTGFLAFLVGLVIALCALLLWIELVVRQAAVMVATLFMPVGFAGMVWESTRHWLRKLAEGLLAFILAKFVITAVVAVGANAIAAGGDNPAALILGAGVLVVAVFTPYVLLSIIPLGTLAVAEGLSRRPLHAGSSAMSTLYWGQALLGGGGGGANAAAPVPAGGGAAPPAGGLPTAGGQAPGGGAGGAGAGGGPGGATAGGGGGAAFGGGSGGAGGGAGMAHAGASGGGGGAPAGAGPGGAGSGGGGAATGGAGAGAGALPVAGAVSGARAASPAGHATVGAAGAGGG